MWSSLLSSLERREFVSSSRLLLLMIATMATSAVALVQTMAMMRSGGIGVLFILSDNQRRSAGLDDRVAMMKIAVVALFAIGTLFAQPLRLYPENPHYFLFAGQPTVLVTSGEHYGAVLNRDFDYVRYLNTLRADHLNLTRTFSGAYREVFGNFKIANNTLAPAPGRFIAPWRQKDGKFDLTQWDDAYFARLKDFVAQARRRGVVVEFVLFCPFYRDSMWNVSPMNSRNNVNGVGDVVRTDVFALKDERLTGVQDAMTRKIVSELREFDNLYYEICNEPYFGGVTPAWQEHIAKVIAATEAGFLKKHLIDQNWANGSVVVDHPDPLVSLFTFHYSRPPDSVAMNWELNRAIGNNETGFDGNADATYRIQGWDFLMAGGALYNNLDYSFTVGHEDGTFAPPPSTPGGGSAALRRQLRYLRAFFGEIPFWRMQPSPEGMVRAPEGATARALEQPGKIYAIYIHHGHVVKNGKPRYQVDETAASRRIEVRLPQGTYKVTWRDTRTGRDVKTEKFKVAGTGREMTLTTPVYAEDIAAILRAADK